MFKLIKEFLKCIKLRDLNNNVETNNSNVFINKPIDNLTEDVLGIKSYIDRINKAIDENATVIGVIGDYGTGKSSLIETFKQNNKETININMWDRLNNKNTDQNNICELTKNFLFQMAIGKDIKFAQYINKRLSKNYGIISIIKNGKHFWAEFILAAIFLLIYKVMAECPDNIYNTAIYNSLKDALGSGFFPNGNIQNIIIIAYGFIFNFKLLFLGIAIVMGFCLILKTTIIFSLWNSQGKVNPDSNDLYDIYLEVANEITEEGNKKKIVVIEDLDRTNKIDDVKEFIKEIYKFTNVLPENISKKIVYIIEVKSEEALNKENTEKYDNLYKKIFDFKVILNTIHTSDYEKILLELLKQKNFDVENELPEKYAYIIKGNNLTIRDIKERLNRSLEIFETLKYKDTSTNTVIDYHKCAIVAYLEGKYPNEMMEFKENDNIFSDILEKAYIIKQDKSITDTNKIRMIFENISNKIKDRVEFGNEIAEMIVKGLIDEDFRLYFYNYPKGQKIKTAEETYVENLILYPNDSDIIIESKIIKALKDNDNIIRNSYKRRIKEKLGLPKIILENENLYKEVILEFYGNCLEILKKEVKWGKENIDEAEKILNKIANYNLDSSKLLIEYSKLLIEELKSLSPKDIIRARTGIIKNSLNYLECFTTVFVNDSMPLISLEELDIIKNMKIKLNLINEKIIEKDNLEYIFKILNSEKLDDENFNRAKEIYYEINTTIQSKDIGKNVFEFLKINNKIDDKLFKIVEESYIEDINNINDVELVIYLNQLDINKISIENLKSIDNMKIRLSLSDELLNKLKENNFKKTLFINLIIYNKIMEMEINNEIEEKLQIIKEIYDVIKDKIIYFRKKVLEEKLIDEYKELFFENYVIISSDELEIIDDIETIKKVLNCNNINEENIKYIRNRINKIYSKPKELVDIIEIFDKVNLDNYIKDTNLIQQFFTEFEWKKKILKGLSEDETSYIYKILKEPLILIDNINAINFSYKMGYIIKELDIQLCTFAKTNDGNNNKYFELINYINDPTEQTIKNIVELKKENKINTNITDRLFLDGYIKEYIVGKVLWENNLVLELEKIDLEDYIVVYKTTILAAEIMSNNNEFLNLIMNKDKFYELDNIKNLIPLYTLRQPIKFVKYLFEVLQEKDIYEYLRRTWHLNTEEDSEEFQKFICEENNIKYIESEEMYYIVKEKLWKASHKGKLTKARNLKYNTTID